MTGLGAGLGAATLLLPSAHRTVCPQRCPVMGTAGRTGGHCPGDHRHCGGGEGTNTAVAYRIRMQNIFSHLPFFNIPFCILRKCCLLSCIQDSKYSLLLVGMMVVFETGVKRKYLVRPY